MSFKQYEYKVKIWLGPLIILFFGSGPFVFIDKALHSTQGVIVYRVIKLSPSQAPYFYWILVLLTLYFCIIGFMLFLASFKPNRFVTLDSTKITAPKSGISDQMVEIRYQDISSVEVQKINHQIFIRIESPDAKISIPRSRLASKSDFDELSSVLYTNINNARTFNSI